MSRVLLLGESWFVHSIHQKGFDTFTTSVYEEGGAEFLAGLRGAGHSVTHVPAHLIDTVLPATPEGLAELADVVVLSDVGANTFQLPPEVFARSRPADDRIAALAGFAAAGGGLAMIGGYMSFSGIDAKARWGRTVLADVLPVRMQDRDDRVELPAGVRPTVTAVHPIVSGLDERWPTLLGLNDVAAKPDAEVLATAGGHPLLVVGAYGRGRTAAFSSDLAPHWATPGFLAWPGYAALFDQLIRWLSSEELS